MEIQNENTITNFSVLTTGTPDILEPTFARNIGAIVEKLRSGYNRSAFAAALQNFIRHLNSENNPHDVTEQQLNIDPTYLLGKLYLTYCNYTNNPISLQDFVTNLLSKPAVANANALSDPNQLASIITSTLMGILFVQHNTDMTAHPAIQQAFDKYLAIPQPIAVYDRLSLASDAFIDPSVRTQYIGQEAITKTPNYLPLNSGAILAKVRIPSTLASDTLLFKLANVSLNQFIIAYFLAADSKIHISTNMIGSNILDASMQQVNQDVYFSVSYDSSGICISGFNLDFSQQTFPCPGFTFNVTSLTMNKTQKDNPLKTLMLFPRILSSTEIQAVFNLNTQPS